MKNPFYRASIVVLASFGLLLASAHAATVTFTAPVRLNVASPATTLTVASGSIANVITLNATSVIVSLSGGQLFTLNSPSYNLLITTSTSGGTVTNTCANGLVTATLSQSSGATAYTLVPIGTSCSSASAPIISDISSNPDPTDATILWTTNIAADSTVFYGATTSYGATSTAASLVTSHSMVLSGLSPSTTYHFAVMSSENGTSTTSGDNTFTTAAASSGGNPTINVGSNGGGGGGGGAYITPTTVTSSSTAQTTTSISGLQAILDSLIAQLNALEAQAAGAGTGTTGSTAGTSGGGASGYVFTRNLKLLNTGADVTMLQKYLNAKGFTVAKTGAGSSGYETQKFGAGTYYALIKFQTSAKIKPASGYFGPLTRAYVNAHEAGVAF